MHFVRLLPNTLHAVAVSPGLLHFVRARTPAASATAWMLEALAMRARGELLSPARARSPIGPGSVVMTAGATADWYGYRIYDTLPTREGQQVVVAHDRNTGNVSAIYVGTELGPMRTGALGGAAATLLGPQAPAVVAVIGAGRQAWRQLWAMASVMEIDDIRIASRQESSRTSFATRARAELGLSARPFGDVAEAVRGADVVSLATNSTTPVIDGASLQPDVFVVTLGPKQVGRAEFDMGLVDGAEIVVTDSPSQLIAYSPPALVAANQHSDQVSDLADLALNQHSHRAGRRVYLSVGLAGTEVHLLHRIASASSTPFTTLQESV